jgi:hypothetical protein
MKKSLIALLFLSSVGFAQEASDFKFFAHQVGEDTQTFFAVEVARGNSIIDSCKAKFADSELVERVGKLKGCLADPREMSKPCQKLITDAALQTAQIEMDRCLELTPILRGEQKNIGSQQMKLRFPGQLLFDNGKLREIEIDFASEDSPAALSMSDFRIGYDGAFRDFSDRFGKPSREWTEDFQNKFGARYTFRRAMWQDEKTAVQLTETQDGSAFAVAEDREYFAKKQEAESAAHRNVLDH